MGMTTISLGEQSATPVSIRYWHFSGYRSVLFLVYLMNISDGKLSIDDGKMTGNTIIKRSNHNFFPHTISTA